MSIPSRPGRSGRRRLAALSAAAMLTFAAACGGTTGEETTTGSEGNEGGEDLPLIYGVFATPLEEPWDGAIHAFNEVLSLQPSDAPSRMYIERCGYWRDNPPAPNWDGVWVLTEK